MKKKIFTGFVVLASSISSTSVIECHPYAQRLAMCEKVKPYGIQVEYRFPLGGAMSNGALFKDSKMKD